MPWTLRHAPASPLLFGGRGRRRRGSPSQRIGSRLRHRLQPIAGSIRRQDYGGPFPFELESKFLSFQTKRSLQLIAALASPDRKGSALVLQCSGVLAAGSGQLKADLGILVLSGKRSRT